MGAIISPRDDSKSALERARVSEKSGDLLEAYDLLVEALATSPDSIDLKHRAVLMLARTGATAHARREYVRLGLEDVADHEDVLALGGRLLKDLALAAEGDARTKLAHDSARKYAKAYAVSGGYYPGINLATMMLLAGEPARASERAREVLDKIETLARDSRDYYLVATAAEANLLLGRVAEADTLFARAIALDPKDFASHASTLRQFDVICRALDISPAWLDAHRPPSAAFYCGHMFALPGAYPPELLSKLKSEIDSAIAQTRPGAVFGALAAGSDIMLAEAALQHGAELHVILPMREDDFIQQSVAPFGDAWVPRFHDSLRRAATYRFATHEPFLGDNTVFSYGSEIAMGLAVRHAATLQTRAHLLSVWDGVPSSGAAGTGADVARWERTGHAKTIIPFASAMRGRPSAPSAQTAPAQPAARELKTMLFGDVRGFSKLEESQIKLFVDHILTPLAEELRRLPAQPDEVATWGDGLYIVYDNVGDAAAGALALLRRFSEIDLAAAGLPSHLALRLGGHAGPVSPLTDPFMGTLNFFGTHVTLAARIEPVAMPGSFYVSEPFAAQLSLAAPDRYQTNYVGQTELAKKFGSMRLFAVNEVSTGHRP